MQIGHISISEGSHRIYLRLWRLDISLDYHPKWEIEFLFRIELG